MDGCSSGTGDSSLGARDFLLLEKHVAAQHRVVLVEQQLARQKARLARGVEKAWPGRGVSVKASRGRRRTQKKRRSKRERHKDGKPVLAVETILTMEALALRELMTDTQAAQEKMQD